MAETVGPEDRTQLIASVVKPPYLVIVDGPHKGSRFPLHSGKNIIGRLPSAAVFLEDQSISRQHAVLELQGNQWIVEDNGSKNGTQVNGTKIKEPVTIGQGDVLKFGIYIFRLILQQTEFAEEMKPPPGDMQEWGTVLMEQPTEGETVNLEAREAEELQTPDDKTGTENDLALSEESPEEELLEEEGEEPPAPKKPSFRLWILLALLLVALVGSGLYFYWRLVLMPHGKHPPVAAKPAGETEKIQSIPLGPPVPPAPEKIPVFLDCVASPLPATIRFDGKDLGRSPLKANLSLVPGQSYEATAVFDLPELTETYSALLRFQVDRDKSVVPLLFRAPIGVIKFLDLPRDASAYLEAYFDYDKFRGRPIKLQELVLNKPIYSPYGRYILEVRQPKAVGDGTFVESIIYRREFIVAEDRPTFEVTINDETLKQFPADIRSIPSEANVFVDGTKVGVTPFVGMLPLGQHTLTLQKDGYFENKQQISMDINTPLKTEVKLETSQAGEKLNAARAAFNSGVYQEAITNLAAVFDFSPTDGETAEARYYLGLSYSRLGDNVKAESYFQQASANETWKYKSLLGLVEVYAAKEENEKGLPYLVDVLLNAKEEEVKKEANDVFHKISPFRSLVYIYTNPPGAVVTVNDKKIDQVTPVILHELSFGNYKIRVEKAGYKTQDTTLSLSVNEFSPVLLTLQPNQ